ncbi:MAG: hypothetical protein QG552_691 [Thermodesulfobacteriota bacterium]|nr:hypothetical protein [Thermodesulfobacteriota bacterium]
MEGIKFSQHNQTHNIRATKGNIAYRLRAHQMLPDVVVARLDR